MAFLSSEVSDHLTQDIVDSLNRHNYWTVNDIIATDLLSIKNKTGVPISVLTEVVKDAREKYVIKASNLASLFTKLVEKSILCPTGIPELTTMLEGGYQTGEIVEIFGESETGKTEFCYLLCAEILTHYDDVTILYIASNHEINTRRIVTYIHDKIGSATSIDDTAMLDLLSRVEVARPTQLSELVHLLNTTIHFDRHNKVRCVIIDSLSFIVQDDILTVKSSDIADAAAAAALSGDGTDDSSDGISVPSKRHLNQATAMSAVANLLSNGAGLSSTNIESIRRETLDIYLHEVMRLLTSFANIKNSIVFVTSSDTPLLNSSLSQNRTWSNAIDTRIRLEKLPDFSDILRRHSNETVRRAIITKHQHGINQIGRYVVFLINETGIRTIHSVSESEN